MEALLKLVHEDFELLVSCNSYDRIYRKAAECMRVEQDSEALLSYYIWDGDKAVLTFRGISIEKERMSLPFSLKIRIISIGFISRNKCRRLA